MRSPRKKSTQNTRGGYSEDTQIRAGDNGGYLRRHTKIELLSVTDDGRDHPPTPGPGQLRLASAGPPGLPIRRRHPPRRQRRASAAERDLAPAGQRQPPPCWPRAIRAVRAWLAPRIALQRWWQTWSKAPPPRQLQALMT